MFNGSTLRLEGSMFRNEARAETSRCSTTPFGRSTLRREATYVVETTMDVNGPTLPRAGRSFSDLALSTPRRSFIDAIGRDAPGRSVSMALHVNDPNTGTARLAVRSRRAWM